MQNSEVLPVLIAKLIVSLADKAALVPTTCPAKPSRKRDVANHSLRRRLEAKRVGVVLPQPVIRKGYRGTSANQMAGTPFWGKVECGP